MTRTILIAGASGVIGTAAVEHFARLPGWRVIALSRRLPVVAADCAFAHLPVDLSDIEACRAALAALPEVTHLIYAAAFEQEGLVEGWRDPATMALNGRMFANLIDPLADTETCGMSACSREPRPMGRTFMQFRSRCTRITRATPTRTSTGFMKTGCAMPPRATASRSRSGDLRFCSARRRAWR